MLLSPPRLFSGSVRLAGGSVNSIRRTERSLFRKVERNDSRQARRISIRKAEGSPLLKAARVSGIKASRWQYPRANQNAKRGKRGKPPAPIDTISRPKPMTDKARHCAWPASDLVIPKVRSFLIDCAAARSKTLIVPNPDEDGLSAGVILYRTLSALGLPSSCIDVHLLGKAATIDDQAERLAMEEKKPKYMIVLGHGNRHGPPVITSAATKTLIIDNHWSNGSTREAMIVSSYNSPSAVACALLTYEICKKLHPDVDDSCGYLCILGTQAYEKKIVEWVPPKPDMTAVFHVHKQKLITKAIELVRAPRLTPAFDITSAWQALLASETPKDVLDNKTLLSARQQVETEKSRAVRLPPTFSSDKKFVVFKIHSEYQIHSAIAVDLKHRYFIPGGPQIIMVYNTGYHPGMIAFSCQAQSQEPETDATRILKDVVSRGGLEFAQQMSESFVRGIGDFVITASAQETNELRKPEATADGIISLHQFNKLLALMNVVVEDILLDNTQKFRRINLPSETDSKRAKNTNEKNRIQK